MEKLYRIIAPLSARNNFPAYSAIFRIYLAFHLIKKIFLSWGSISLVNGDLMGQKMSLPSVLSYLSDVMINGVPLIYYAGIMTAFLYMFGIGRFYTAIVFHVLCRLLIDMNFMYSNGGDNILVFVSFYMIFVNSYEHFCLNPGKPNKTPLSHFVSNLGSYAIVIQLCIIYLASALHKIHSDVWFNGVATYYIMNLEMYKSPINDFFFKNAFIIGASTYFTLAFELFFPVLIWNKSFRPVFLVAGLLIHLGIYFTMMIYDFEILFIMTYGFFISNKFWESLISKRYNFSRIRIHSSATEQVTGSHQAVQ